MEREKALEISDYARRRMFTRGLNENHIWFCLFNHKKEYRVGRDMVWECKLPDGRNMKVRVRDASTDPI